MDRGAAADAAREFRAVRGLGGAARAGLLPRGTDRPRTGLSRWRGRGALAACRARLGGAVPGWRSALAGDRDRRPVAWGTSRRRWRRSWPRRSATRWRSSSPRCVLRRLTGGRGGLERVARRRGPAGVRTARRGDQRSRRAAGAAPWRRDRRGRAGSCVPDVDPGRRGRRSGRRAGGADVGDVGCAWHSPARCRRGHCRSAVARGVGGTGAAARRAVHRLSGAAVGGAALRPPRRRHGDLRRLRDHRLEYGAERWAIRPRLAHRQPARDPAVHRDRGRHGAAAGRGDRRA